MKTLKPKFQTTISREQILRELERVGVRVIQSNRPGSVTESFSSIVGNRTKPLVIKH